MMTRRTGLKSMRWRRGGRWLVILATLLWGGLLLGCGKGDQPEETPPADGADIEGGAPPADAAPPPGDEEAPPPDPDMAGAPEPGAPPVEAMPGAAGEAAPAPAPQATPVAVAPPHPTRNDPFAALDGPEKPEPPPPILPPPPSSHQLMPIRATVEVSLPAPPPEGVTDSRLPDVRTSGILWGPTVKAIVQYRDQAGAEQNAVVKPGDELPIRSPGGTQLTVQSIGPDGVQLLNTATRRVYFAPLQGR